MRDARRPKTVGDLRAEDHELRAQRDRAGCLPQHLVVYVKAVAALAPFAAVNVEAHVEFQIRREVARAVPMRGVAVPVQRKICLARHPFSLVVELAVLDEINLISRCPDIADMHAHVRQQHEIRDGPECRPRRRRILPLDARFVITERRLEDSLRGNHPGVMLPAFGESRDGQLSVRDVHRIGRVGRVAPRAGQPEFPLRRIELRAVKFIGPLQRVSRRRLSHCKRREREEQGEGFHFPSRAQSRARSQSGSALGMERWRPRRLFRVLAGEDASTPRGSTNRISSPMKTAPL